MFDRERNIKQAGNKELPELTLSRLGLDPLEGVLGIDNARHLLERCLFGAKKSELDQYANLTVEQALDSLLATLPAPAPPVNINPDDTGVPLGETWVNAPDVQAFRSGRKKSLRCWWVGLIIGQGPSLVEKMVLFWHNHFVTEVPAVNRPQYLYDYNALLRKHALGNFKDLTGEMTISTAMLKYLNGDKNMAGSPNENYARELFELFTIGKGPLIGEGNYTNFTEEDIQEAARVLTGWKIDVTTQASWFNVAKHDAGTKTFSDIYGNHQIVNNGDQEYLDLVSMIFGKKETARHLVRKLYRWFVYYIIDETIENLVIEPLATTLYDSGFEMLPVLRQLLSSEHFFDQTYRACYIRNPYEHVAGTLRKLEAAFPTEKLLRYEFWNSYFYQARNQEMKLGEPPDVAGWPGWYLSPQYNQLWINSVSLPQKANFSDRILSNGWTKQGYKLAADPIGVAEMVSTPGDPNILISEWAGLFLPVSLTQEQIDYLKDILIPGLPDFEWTLEWNKYKDNPGDQNQRQAVEAVLRSVLKAMLRMPEYYLM